MPALHQSLLCTCCGKFKSLLDDGDEHTFEFAGGHVYKGQWKGGKQHGKGTFTWKDGGVYEGYFVEGEMEGPGKMTYKDGTVYEGQFVANLPEGECSISFPPVEKEGGGEFPGAAFKGTCKRGEAEGSGTFTYPVGTERVGHWSAGALAYEEGGESTWDQGANALTGISGASAAAMGQEVPLNFDMRSVKRQKSAKEVGEGDAEAEGGLIRNGSIDEGAEGDQEEIQPRVLPGFGDVNAEALGEEVVLDFNARSLTRGGSMKAK